MTYKNMHVRSAMTAITAVLALSSTPLVAQEAATPPDPVTETPSNPPPVTDPLAPGPAVAEPAAPEPEATEATETAPAETAVPATTRRAARARTTATNRVPSQPVRTTTSANPAPTSEAPTGEGLEPLPLAPPPAAPVAEPIAPPAAEPVTPSSDLLADEALPIAGAAGLGLLALAGIGLAVRRRRRRRDEMAHYDANQRYLAEHPPEPVPNAPMPSNNEPAFVRARQSGMAAVGRKAAAGTDVPRTKLPSGFDLSRFGPHVRAAYQGPTPDNPSLSLKYRLRRAGAMDQRARLEAEKRPQAQTPARRPEPARQPAWGRNGESFMLRRSTAERRGAIAEQSRGSAKR